MDTEELSKHVGKTVNVHANTNQQGNIEYNEWVLEKGADHNGEATFKVWNFCFTAAQVTRFRASPQAVLIHVKKQTVEKMH